MATAALLLPTMAAGQAAFEGTIKATMSGGGMEIGVVQHARGSMMRQDMSMGNAGSMSIITDAESKKAIMLVHDQKMWMDMAAINEMMANMPGMGRQNNPPEGEPATLPEIRRTDRVETIAGHECRHYIIVNPSGDIDLCAITGLGFFMPGGGPPAMGPMGGGMRGPSMPSLPRNSEMWLKEFADGFFVLKLEAATPQGAMTWVVQSIERKTIPEELFRPPADYSEMKMPGR
ncbi:MAG: DUF4412 domain-containing protein [Gemmatimonadetes bacterium]|nr:DUF4412 domain-containing protein [Gemmatimonadota bacterium]